MTVHPQFFEAAAQLIPVLLIAAAVDARGWASREPQTHGQALSEIYALLWLTLTWLLSLYAVAVQSRSPSLFAFVVLGLAIGWGQIAYSIASGQIARVRRAKVTKRMRAAAAAAVLFPLVAVVVLGFMA